ncbi:MAG: DSBA-like thioredoxin domain protein [Pelotomaculum sp. PtaB.Bin104]|nr:MAG: DSBA-like thioredoxin domain protein [Pelotomaculum sp. PtaB.Bin104]
MEAVKANFERLGAAEGIRVRLNSHQCSSRLALEGAKYAENKGKFTDYHRMVFQAQFVEDRDIVDMDVLADIAGKAELDQDDFRACLAERRMKPMVDADVAEAARLGVTAVPAFIFNDGAEVIVGAQPLESFRQLLKMLRE